MKIIITVLSFATLITLAIIAQPQRGERPMLPAQAALDANRDGVISADEITQAAAALRKLDKNADGKLTEDELRPNFDREGRGGPVSNPNEEVVNTLMAFDENKDGKLSKQEVPERMQGIFARADANKDNFLTQDELTRMAAAQSAATSANERDDHDDHGEGRGGGRGEGRGGRGGPGGMMRMMPLLTALDANHDGAITEDEINNAPVALKTLDKNADGQLTEDELRPAFGPGGRGRGGPGRERPNGEPSN
ncbi:MAG: EF-hand domain-containing protein [Acidobacteria bacterium]|nr:EF-hand domain-containing protein [Acidobacteriota bacterium]